MTSDMVLGFSEVGGALLGSTALNGLYYFVDEIRSGILTVCSTGRRALKVP
jgi:hypothetical protein